MTSAGGVYGVGILFEYDPVTDSYQKKVEFDPFAGIPGTGNTPMGDLIQAENGMLYGMTKRGVFFDAGVLFEYNISTNAFTKKVDFDYTNGASPFGSLIQANNGKLYGTAFSGGLNNAVGTGTLFEYDFISDTLITKHNFDSLQTNGFNGISPMGSPLQASNGRLYGMTFGGGLYGTGTLYEYNLATDSFAKKIDLSTVNGIQPSGSLIQCSNGKLYGLTSFGGTYNIGILLEYDMLSDVCFNKYNFTIIGTGNGSMPLYTHLLELPSTIGLKHLTKTSSINVYPNPSNGKITIQGAENLKINSIKIYNAIGENVYSLIDTKQQNEIDLSSFPKGLYIVKVFNDQNVYSEKLIIQ